MELRYGQVIPEVFCTKYALTKGITKILNGKVSFYRSGGFPNDGELPREGETPCLSVPGSHFYFNRDVFFTFEEAIVKAEAMKVNKIASLEKNIKSLQKKTFQEPK